MAVAVVGPDRDEGYARTGRCEEVGVGVAAAVVGHLEHVGPQVRTRGEDARLGLRAQVTGEQQPHPALGDPHDEGEVVGGGALDGPPRGRREHVHDGGPHRAPLSRLEHLPLAADPPDERVQPALPVVVGGQGAGGDHTDVPPTERPGETADVVGVQVGEQDQRQPFDVQPVEAPVDRGFVRPGVDQHTGAPSQEDHQGIALADITGDEHGVRGRPATHRLPQRPSDDHEPEDGRKGEQAHAREPPEQPGGRQDEQAQQNRTRGAGRPTGHPVGYRCRSSGDAHEPAHGPAGQPDERVGDARMDGAQQCRDQAEDGGRGDRRSGEQIGRQGHQADRAGQAGDDRRGGDPRGGADRERVRDDRRAPVPAHPPAPAGSDQDDRRGRRDGEREAGVVGQPGLDQQQDGHGTAEGGERRPRPPRREGQQRHATHHGRAQHARAGTGHDDEADQGESRHHRLEATVGGPAAKGPQHAGEHDRNVRPRDRRQVGEPGAPELLDQDRVHRRGVAHHEARQQARRTCLEHPRRRRGECLADRRGTAVQPAGSIDDDRRPPGRQHGDDLVRFAGQSELRAQPDDVSGAHLRPVVRAGEHEHGGAERDRPRPVRERGDRRGHEHARGRTATAGEDARHLVDGEHQGGAALLHGSGAQG
jgi:hypothetical protein